MATHEHKVVPPLPTLVQVWDNAGIERNVEPVDAKEIIENGGTSSNPEKPALSDAAEEASAPEKPSKSKGK